MASFAVQEFSSGVERVVKEVSLISEMAGIATSGTHNVSATEEQLASYRRDFSNSFFFIVKKSFFLYRLFPLKNTG